MFRRIMVPIDGSPTSSRGLDEAIALAEDQNAKVFLLHVVDDMVLSMALDSALDASGVYFDRLYDALVEGGKAILAKGEARVRKRGIACEQMMIETRGRSVAEVIIAQSKKVRADLIVLGTHGRRGVTRLVMGSDAEGVVHSSPVPVMLVRSPAGAARRGGGSRQLTARPRRRA